MARKWIRRNHRGVFQPPRYQLEPPMIGPCTKSSKQQRVTVFEQALISSDSRPASSVIPYRLLSHRNQNPEFSSTRGTSPELEKSPNLSAATILRCKPSFLIIFHCQNSQDQLKQFPPYAFGLSGSSNSRRDLQVFDKLMDLGYTSTSRFWLPRVPLDNFRITGEEQLNGPDVRQNENLIELSVLRSN